MAEQKRYKFIIIMKHDDCTKTKEIECMTTKEAREFCSKLADLKSIDSVELYRINKTEVFA